MAEAQQVGGAVGAHLVGGLSAADAETAMCAAAGILGRHLRSLTDGETGERNQWIGWQMEKLMALEGVAIGGMRSSPSRVPEYAEFPTLSAAPSVTELPERATGYADAAEDSYPIFCRLRDEGAIPVEVKFQVSIPTPYATIIAFVRDEDQVRFFSVYEAALAAEVEAITRLIPASDLVIQYDVAIEVGVLAGSLASTAEVAQPDFVVDTLRRALDRRRTRRSPVLRRLQAQAFHRCRGPLVVRGAGQRHRGADGLRPYARGP